MADKKITQLTELGTAAAADLLPIVDVSEPIVADQTKKIQKQNIMATPGPIGSNVASTGEFTTLELPTGTIINEFSIDGTLVGNSDDAVPTEKAVKTYVDSQITTPDHNTLLNLQGGDSTAVEFYHLTQAIYDGLFSASPVIGIGSSTGTNIQVDYGNGDILFQGDLGAGQQAIMQYDESSAWWKIGNQLHTYIYLREMDDAGDGSIRLIAADDIQLRPVNELTIEVGVGPEQVTVDTSGVTLSSGATINEFSIDGTLGGDSDIAVPTEQAVKTYVDAQITTVDEHNELLGLQGGDSTAEFYHLTQQIHDSLYSASPVIGLGSPSGTNLEVDFGSHVVTIDGNGTNVFNIQENTQTFGTPGTGTNIVINQSADNISMYMDPGGGHGYSQVIDIDGSAGSNEINIGVQTEVYLKVNIGSSPVVRVMSGTDEWLYVDADAQRLGDDGAGGDWIQVNPASSTITANIASVPKISLAATTQTFGVTGVDNLLINESTHEIQLNVSGGDLLSIRPNNFEVTTAGTKLIDINDELVVIGLAAGPKIVVDYGDDIAIVMRDHNNVQVFEIDNEEIQIGTGSRAEIRMDYESGVEYIAHNFNFNEVFRSEASGVTVTGDAHITGDLTIDGTATIINTTILEVEDNVVLVNKGEPGAGVTAGVAGIRVDRGSLTDYRFIFDESDDYFKVGELGSEKRVALYEDLTSNVIVGNEALLNDDTTATVIFGVAQSDANYGVAWSLVNTTDFPPSIYAGTIYDKTINGFSVIFSGSMDTDNYVLSWIVTR